MKPVVPFSYPDTVLLYLPQFRFHPQQDSA